jgi:hypothetical protein
MLVIQWREEPKKLGSWRVQTEEWSDQDWEFAGKGKEIWLREFIIPLGKLPFDNGGGDDASSNRSAPHADFAGSFDNAILGR